VTGQTRSSHDLDARRRRALFRAWHRGMREVDLLLGPFADAQLGNLSDHDLADFEALMEVPDDELLTWIVGRMPVAPNYRSRVFDLIVEFHTKTHDQS
jgi:antitoxin CptB